jgi:hypothetical protein
MRTVCMDVDSYFEKYSAVSSRFTQTHMHTHKAEL